MEQPIWTRDLPIFLGEIYKKIEAIAPDGVEEKLIDLVEWVHRLPSRNPRRTYLSDVLRGRKILTPYEMNGIRRVRVELENGRDIRPFLGERTASIRNRRDEKRNPKQRNDLFFSDWGLHHFHLGADLVNTGKRVMRSRRVLIAHLTESDAYLLDVVPHGKGFPDVWGDTTYLKILYRNWPEVLEQYELKGLRASALEDEVQPFDYIKLRQCGINVPIEINGKIFMGPGLGISGDGSSTRAVQRADNIQSELYEGEKLFREQQPEVGAFLYVGKDASVGFFVPGKDAAFSVFSGQNSHYHVTAFLNRLIHESGIFEKLPEGTIWTPVPRHS